MKKLRRFKKLKTETRIRLFKTLIRPILEYPPVPTCVTSRTSHVQLQRVQNVALRAAAKERPSDRRSTNEELHNKYQLETINVRLHNQAQKVWNRLESINPEWTNNTQQIIDQTERDHTWWPSVCRFLGRNPPEPIYI